MGKKRKRDLELMEFQQVEKANTLNEVLEVVNFLEGKKVKDIVVIDISKLTTIAYYFVICSVDTNLQMESLVGDFTDKYGGRVESGGGWTLIDKDTYVVHIFLPEVREYYSLENLWLEGEFIKGKEKVFSHEKENI